MYLMKFKLPTGKKFKTVIHIINLALICLFPSKFMLLRWQYPSNYSARWRKVKMEAVGSSETLVPFHQTSHSFMFSTVPTKQSMLERINASSFVVYCYVHLSWLSWDILFITFIFVSFPFLFGLQTKIWILATKSSLCSNSGILSCFQDRVDAKLQHDKFGVQSVLLLN
jgi:hypothetical protein